MLTRQRIKNIDPLSLAKMTGIPFLIFSVILLPLSVIFVFINREAALMMAIAAIFYPVAGFFQGYIAGWIYNLFAKWLGGIEIELESTDSIN